MLLPVSILSSQLLQVCLLFTPRIASNHVHGHASTTHAHFFFHRGEATHLVFIINSVIMQLRWSMHMLSLLGPHAHGPATFLCRFRISFAGGVNTREWWCDIAVFEVLPEVPVGAAKPRRVYLSQSSKSRYVEGNRKVIVCRGGSKVSSLHAQISPLDLTLVSVTHHVSELRAPTQSPCPIACFRRRHCNI